MLIGQSTIIVRVVEQEPTTGFDLADILIRALGVTGVMILGSVVLGVILGAAFIGYRILQRRRRAAPELEEHLHITGPVAYAPSGQAHPVSPPPARS